MIIADLNHLETLTKSDHIVGGLADIADINVGSLTNQVNISSIRQYAFSLAIAFGSAQSYSNNISVVGHIK